MFIRRIYSKWTFFSFSLYLAFHILSDAVIVMSSPCFSPSPSPRTRRNSSVYNIPFVHFSIQSNKINQKCLARPFLIVSAERSAATARQKEQVVKEKSTSIPHRCDSLSGSFQLLFFSGEIIILCPCCKLEHTMDERSAGNQK